MSIQFLTNTAIHINYAFALPTAYPTTNEPFRASSRDYGFDFDEDELASELLAPLPASLADSPIHPVEADDFESLYRWFNS